MNLNKFQVDEWVKDRGRTNPEPFFPSACLNEIELSFSEVFLRLLELTADGKLVLKDYRDIKGEELKKFEFIDLEMIPYFEFSLEYLEWLNSI
jgi:hypothetical protein